MIYYGGVDLLCLNSLEVTVQYYYTSTSIMNMNSRSTSPPLNFSDLTLEKQRDDYCEELKAAKYYAFATQYGGQFQDQITKLRSKETVYDLEMSLKEKEQISIKEKERLQLQVDYWKATCNHHIKKERSETQQA